MFEVMNITLADQKALKVHLKKVSEAVPQAEMRYDKKVNRYYICLGEYPTLELAEQRAKEFRRKHVFAGVKVD